MNKRAKILIVDDEPFNIDYLEQELVELGCDTFSASNGREALEQVAAQAPDVILLDIMMPVMDGLTATKKIREMESSGHAHTPIIAITANALEGDRENCLTAGADDYIAKPFQADMLLRKMKDLLV